MTYLPSISIAISLLNLTLIWLINRENKIRDSWFGDLYRHQQEIEKQLEQLRKWRSEG